ncbi:MAG TPA: RNA-binding cell elongation regulator Jag/EloR [Candidatus Limnocylindrales bacterium]
MSEYQEFTGKSVEEALRGARDAFGVDLDDLDFEILSSGSRGVLGMGAEPARVLAAPRSALGGSAPKREAAEAKPLPAPAPRPRDDDREGPRDRDRGRGRDDRRPRREGDRGARGGPRPERPVATAREERRPRPPERGTGAELSTAEAEEVAQVRGSLAAERADLEAAQASTEALGAGQEILEELLVRMGFDTKVEVMAGDTSRLNVIGEGHEKEALGALIGRKGERLSALQHLVNLMLSKRMGEWTRVLVDVEDYRGRRERQLSELAKRAADRVVETGRMLQLDPMSALERRWVHLALRDYEGVATQSIGEEPERRVVVLPRNG